MALTVNTNVASLNAQRNLTNSQSAQTSALERLSSGLRINSAKDDAAGLAISERFTTQIRGLNQAARNANDGISLAQTAEGAMGGATELLQRVRELAIQSANATNSATDRSALQQEASQLLDELDRIASTTEFNGTKLLDGNFTTQQFQVGANANQTINLSVDGIRTSQAGAVATATSDSTNSVGTAATQATGITATAFAAANYTGVDSNSTGSGLTINNTAVSDSANYAHATDTNRAGDSAYAKALAINGSDVAGVSATADTTVTFAAETGGFTDISAINGGDTVDYSLSINGQAIISGQSFADAGADLTMDSIVTAINSVSADTGVVATNDGGNLKLQAEDGRNIKIDETVKFNDDATASVASTSFKTAFSNYTISDTNTTADDTGANLAQSQTVRGKVTLESSSDITVNAGTALLGLSGGSIAASGSLDNVDISTVAGANSALGRIDSALDQINSSRATLGALQSRFEAVVSNIGITSENLSAARSRILDADFAAETATLTRSQILQQAGVSALAQANSLPQLALSLLQ